MSPRTGGVPRILPPLPRGGQGGVCPPTNSSKPSTTSPSKLTPSQNILCIKFPDFGSKLMKTSSTYLDTFPQFSQFFPLFCRDPAMAVALGQGPLAISAAVALASSCAFMLPVATPPNAIVFGSGRLTLQEMMRAGLWMNIFCWLILSAWLSWVAPKLPWLAN